MSRIGVLHGIAAQPIPPKIESMFYAHEGGWHAVMSSSWGMTAGELFDGMAEMANALKSVGLLR